jgi:hypothetical protein
LDRLETKKYGYEFDFGIVTQYPCGNANLALTPATTWLFFSALTSGIHNLTIEFNAVNYRGTLSVNETSYSFNWNNTSGVLISPLTREKQ